jgi:hypothetical protein
MHYLALRLAAVVVAVAVAVVVEVVVEVAPVSPLLFSIRKLRILMYQ